jgi:hypothetical protein
MNNSKGLSMFQIGIFIACAAGIVFAILIFSGKIPLGETKTTQTLKGSVVIWGTLPGDSVRAMTVCRCETTAVTHLVLQTQRLQWLQL